MRVFFLVFGVIFPMVAYAACDTTTVYSSCNPGYEMVGTTCTACAKGYYKASTGTSKCERCPPSGGVYGTTASTASTAKTDCYIPSGTSMSDTTGAYEFTSNCYYTE